jgi:hypothetical protein
MKEVYFNSKSIKKMFKHIEILLRAVAKSFHPNAKNEMNKIKTAYNNVYSA